MTLAEIRVAARLVRAHAFQHPGRVLLTTLSTVAAACVVVWVVSGYDALVEKFDDFAEDYLGRYELIVVPTVNHGESGFGNAPIKPLSKDLVLAMTADPDIAAIDGVFQTRATIRDTKGRSESTRGMFGPGGGPPTGNQGKADAPAADKATPVAGATPDAVPPPEVERRGETRRGSGKRGGRRPGGATGDANPNGDAKGDAGKGGDGRGAYGKGGFGKGSPYFSSPVASFSRAPVLVGTNATEPPYKLVEGNWIDPQQPDKLEAAISRGVAEQWDLKLGDEVIVSTEKNREETRLKIVGFVEQLKNPPTVSFRIGLPPSRAAALARGPASSALYVPVALAEKLAGQPAEYNFAGIVLKNGAEPSNFRARWKTQLAEAAPAAQFQALEEVGEELHDSSASESMRMQAYSATGISLLASLFIIFTTLSMGVHERIRQFAVLRAVSLTKAQVALMIAIESLGLGLIGWAGGLLAGWGLFAAVRALRPDVFASGASLGSWCFILSGVCALGGSLAAAIMPAWRATRVSPLEAMSPQSSAGSGQLGAWITAIGVALVCVNPLVVFYIPMKDTARYGISAAIGCTTMAVGFILLAPAAIRWTERWLGPVLARLLRINPSLLATQLSANLWRSVGTTVALTLGLGLFVAMQTWGYSMLGPYTPGDWVPDMLVGLTPTGVPLANLDEVRAVPGVKKGQCVPLAVEQTKFAGDVTGADERANSARQDNCVILGIDPELALGGDKPIFDFKFAQGNRADAIAKLKQGRHCLVPDHFARESGLGVGDTFSVTPPEAPDKPLTYEIAGVVSMTGWHWMSKLGLRTRDGGRSAGLMFTGYDQSRADYNLDRITFFWMNLDGTASEEQVQAGLQAVAEKHYDPERAKARRRGRGMMMAGGPGGPGGRSGSPVNVNVRTREGVRTAIRERADGIIWAISQLPLVTLAVTSLGVINTVLSSIRARRWDMGVLRALGLTRLGLFRLILAEALLVGAAACLLSLGFGVMAGYCGTGVTRYMNVRGGQITPLVIPWAKLSTGFAITLGLCLIAALWPAIRTGRTEPLRLLQAGRTAT